MRHTWITASKNKVRIPDAHSSMLTNHKIRFSNNGDVHEGYNHPDIDDLRASQQFMTDYILAKIDLKPTKGKKRSGNNVVLLTTPKAA